MVRRYTPSFHTLDDIEDGGAFELPPKSYDKKGDRDIFIKMPSEDVEQSTLCYDFTANRMLYFSSSIEVIPLSYTFKFRIKSKDVESEVIYEGDKV